MLFLQNVQDLLILGYNDHGSVSMMPVLEQRRFSANLSCTAEDTEMNSASAMIIAKR